MLAIQKLTIADLAAAHRVRNDIYAQPGGSAGCCWHIFLDDHNLDDDSVAFCVGRAAEASHPICVALGPFVLRMSATQRAKLVHGGYHNIDRLS